MEFLRKNGVKMFMMTITLAGVAMFITLLARFSFDNYGITRNPSLGVDGGRDTFHGLGFLFTYIAALLFFTSGTVVLAVMMFKKTQSSAKWVLCAAGILGLTLMIMSSLFPLRSDSFALMREIRAGERNAHIQSYVQYQIIWGAGDTNLMTFATMPINEWQTGAQSLYQLSQLSPQPMTEAQLAALQGALAHIASIVEAESQIAIDTAINTAAYQYLQNTIVRVSTLLIFGSLPLFFGISMLLAKREEPTIQES